jgi:hypothetical protein
MGRCNAYTVWHTAAHHAMYCRVFVAPYDEMEALQGTGVKQSFRMHRASAEEHGEHLVAAAFSDTHCICHSWSRMTGVGPGAETNIFVITRSLDPFRT